MSVPFWSFESYQEGSVVSTYPTLLKIEDKQLQSTPLISDTTPEDQPVVTSQRSWWHRLTSKVGTGIKKILVPCATGALVTIVDNLTGKCINTSFSGKYQEGSMNYPGFTWLDLESINED